MPVLFRDSSFDTQIDRLFNEALSAVGGWTASWTPECNVYEDDKTYFVQLALPGIDASRIDVQVSNGILSVKGERKYEGADGRTWYLHEVKDGAFSCSFRLPAYVDHDQSTASYKQGMLTISFPKHEEARTRRIMIECQPS
jgi:HSP20 family protein